MKKSYLIIYPTHVLVSPANRIKCSAFGVQSSGGILNTEPLNTRIT